MIDSVFQSLATRAQFVHLMVAIDIINAVALFYAAVALSRGYGLGGFEERLKFGHRLAILALAIFFAWQALDIVEEAGRYGLTIQTFGLHVAFLITLGFSSVRIYRGIRRIDELERRESGNGGAIVGPFPTPRTH